MLSVLALASVGCGGSGGSKETVAQVEKKLWYPSICYSERTTAQRDCYRLNQAECHAQANTDKERKEQQKSCAVVREKP
jgi:hypothetical protein